MTKTMNQIAVDVGSGFTQYKTETDEGSFISIVSPLMDARNIPKAAENVITIKDETFVVGETAYAYGDPDKRADTLSEEWAGTPAWMALLYSAIAKCKPAPESTITLVTGLPQAVFIEKQEGLKKALKKTHEFTFAGTPYKIKIDPSIIPQASGALLYKGMTDPDLMNDLVGVLDVGTFTTGFSVLEKGNFIYHKCGGCPIGVSLLIKTFQKEISRKYNKMMIDDAIVPQVLMDGKIRINGGFTDVSMDIDRLALKVAKPMLNTLNAKWHGGKELLVYVAGGGAPYFINAIKTSIPHAEVMDNAFFAVVRGMYRYLELEG